MSLSYCFRAVTWMARDVLRAVDGLLTARLVQRSFDGLSWPEQSPAEEQLEKAEEEREVWEVGNRGLPWPQLPDLEPDFRIPVKDGLPYTFTDSAVPPPADGPGGVAAGSPPIPPPGPPTTFVNWAVPAIATILDEHKPGVRDFSAGVYCSEECGWGRGNGGLSYPYKDWQDWYEHVSPLIAAHLEKALTTEFPRRQA